MTANVKLNGLMQNVMLTRVVSLITILTAIVLVASAHYTQTGRLDVLEDRQKRDVAIIGEVQSKVQIDHDILVELRNDVRHIKLMIDQQTHKRQNEK